MKKSALLLVMVATALLMAGCSEPKAQEDDNAPQNSPKKQKAALKPEKTVIVVNQGMSKKEEEELRQRLADLEEKVDDKSQQEPANQGASEPQQDTESTEEQALGAAQDYYAAAAAGDYTYTYNALSSASQSQFTEEEWVAANTTLDSDAGIYHIDATNVVDDSTVVVYLTITSADGSSSERTTQFILENGSWKHDLTETEYELFAGATGSATATASASPSSSASATGDTKHVKVVITSSKPADVSINDDSLNWFITEEIVGTETYEKDIGANSGLSVSATTDAYHAQTTIEVYENGELVAQDSDPNGFAMVNY
jgi:hypothetical protein